jgi:ornithine cyclodeaminase/alanine dehydrogenase-like protein (mu-crystallin family)
MAEGPLWISEADAEALLDPLALIAAVEAGFHQVEAGLMLEPGATRMNGIDGSDAYLTLYPAHATNGYASAKVLAGRPANGTLHRPEIDAVVCLIDPQSGRIAALISARLLTTFRTAAVTAAVFRRLMARPPALIGLIGTGAQALAHGRMFAAAGMSSGFLIASPRGDAVKAQAMAEAITNATSIEALASTTSTIAERCKMIVAMSLANRPLPLGPLLANAVIASIGPFHPHAHEIDTAIVRDAALVISDHPARLRRQWAESPVLDANALSLSSAAELFTDRFTPPSAGVRVFLSDGRAFEDNVAATLVYRAALATGRGIQLP